MKRADKVLTEKHMDLVFEFERYVMANPSFARQIPHDAIVVLQVKGDERFNRWSKRLGENQASGEGRPVVYVTINKLGRIRSRIEQLKIEEAA